MRIALCTTTINVPHVLKLYRACPAGMQMFVAHDIKTPPETYAFVEEIGAAISTGSEYACSDLIGFNSIQRRNVAFLDALKWGAEIIVSIDDDNACADMDYISDSYRRFAAPFSGLQVGTPGSWFDVGSFQYTQAGGCVKQRGFPLGVQSGNTISHAVRAKIGVVQGICLGDPDTSAIDRASQAPEVHQVSELLHAGVVAHPQSWAIYNSQNTAVLRELIPAWGMLPFTGRYDDIFAALICNRIMRDRDMHVFYGPPFAYQQRNQHDLLKDLRAEIDGYETIRPLAALLDALMLPNRSVIGDCRMIWDAIEAASLLPDARTVPAMRAYLDDCERVMG